MHAWKHDLEIIRVLEYPAFVACVFIVAGMAQRPPEFGVAAASMHAHTSFRPRAAA